jgi:hypothetical protein
VKEIKNGTMPGHILPDSVKLDQSITSDGGRQNMFFKLIKSK